MDMIKIGKFIQERRRAVGLTQLQLSEKLGITDRAVSKWENGRSLPDASLMLPLCTLLGISINDLLSGEKVEAGDYDSKAEQNLLLMKKRIEAKNKQLLVLEIILIVISTLSLIAIAFAVDGGKLGPDLERGLLLLGFLVFFLGIGTAVFLEKTTGSYRCKNCGCLFEPKWGAYMLSAHMGYSHYLKCPNCGKKTWCKKTMEETEDDE